MFWLLEAFNKISLVNTIPLPCNRTLWPCHYSEGRILNPEATWMFLGRRCRLPDQGGWCSCIYHCHDCRECNKTSIPMTKENQQTKECECEFIVVCWPDLRFSNLTSLLTPQRRLQEKLLGLKGSTKSSWWLIIFNQLTAFIDIL